MSHEPTFPVSEIIEVTSLEVACDGGGGPLGHPMVFLHIKPEGDWSVQCPYCSRKYVAKPGAGAASH